MVAKTAKLRVLLYLLHEKKALLEHLMNEAIYSPMQPAVRVSFRATDLP